MSELTTRELDTLVSLFVEVIKEKGSFFASMAVSSMGKDELRAQARAKWSNLDTETQRQVKELLETGDLARLRTQVKARI